ncbi:hypothetical protein FKP32DRAFT_58029 [Trametes sanguinea]|nr:hypothetical protein FKP32DRAFT_58029 [Trametes sanguinea]
MRYGSTRTRPEKGGVARRGGTVSWKPIVPPSECRRRWWGCWYHDRGTSSWRDVGDCGVLWRSGEAARACLRGASFKISSIARRTTLRGGCARVRCASTVPMRTHAGLHPNATPARILQAVSSCVPKYYEGRRKRRVPLMRDFARNSRRSRATCSRTIGALARPAGPVSRDSLLASLDSQCPPRSTADDAIYPPAPRALPPAMMGHEAGQGVSLVDPRRYAT